GARQGETRRAGDDSIELLGIALRERHALLAALGTPDEIRSFGLAAIESCDDGLCRLGNGLERGAPVLRTRLRVAPERNRTALLRHAVARIVVPTVLRNDGIAARESVRRARTDI